MNTAAIATLAASVGFGGIVAAVVAALSQRRKVAADASGAIASAAASLLQPLESRLKSQDGELARMRNELRKERHERSVEASEYLDRLYEVDRTAKLNGDRVQALEKDLTACHRQYDDMAVQVAEMQRHLAKVEHDQGR